MGEASRGSYMAAAEEYGRYPLTSSTLLLQTHLLRKGGLMGPRVWGSDKIYLHNGGCHGIYIAAIKNIKQ